MDFFTAVYFGALIIQTVIRAPLNKMRRQEKMSERRFTDQEKILLGLLSLGGLVAPIIYYLRGDELARFCQLHTTHLGELAGRPAHCRRDPSLLARPRRPGTQLVTHP
jgi:hypothetical protein